MTRMRRFQSRQLRRDFEKDLLNMTREEHASMELFGSLDHLRERRCQ
jgi:hypothetical protein